MTKASHIEFYMSIQQLR